MKVFVTSQGQAPSSPVDPRFGRARFFVIHDTGTGGFDVLSNSQNLSAAGAGVQTATCVVEAGAELVVSGQVGPKAMAVLRAAGVRVLTGAEGTVLDALAAMREGRLAEAAEAQTPARHQGRPT